MKYLCLGYLDPQAMDARPQAEIEKLMEECGPPLQELYKTGRVIIDAGLAKESKHLRRVNGKVVVTDGPYTETKELLGSAILIEADDFDDAVRVASLHPTTWVAAGEAFGWHLEIRPVPYFKGF